MRFCVALLGEHVLFDKILSTYLLCDPKEEQISIFSQLRVVMLWKLGMRSALRIKKKDTILLNHLAPAR